MSDEHWKNRIRMVLRKYTFHGETTNQLLEDLAESGAKIVPLDATDEMTRVAAVATLDGLGRRAIINAANASAPDLAHDLNAFKKVTRI